MEKKMEIDARKREDLLMACVLLNMYWQKINMEMIVAIRRKRYKDKLLLIIMW
jgi:hypothetical protein